MSRPELSPETAARTKKGEIPSVFQPMNENVSLTFGASPPPPSSRNQSPANEVEDQPRHSAPLPQNPRALDRSSPQIGQDDVQQPEAGPSTAPAKKNYRKPQPKRKVEGLMQYTSGYVPGMYNIKNPAGDFLQKEANVDVVRQVSQAKAKKEKEEMEAARTISLESGQEPVQGNPLSRILIIHPGSRNLKIGRASDFYPKEVPNCIARPANAWSRGRDPPIPGSRVKGIIERKKRKSNNGNAIHENGEDDPMDDDDTVDLTDKHIEDLRDYLRNRLRSNRLSTDYREGYRVKQTNAKVRPESIPEHNDPYRIDYTEVDGKKYFIGTDAIRLPSDSGFNLRYPILKRSLNLRDWTSPRLLMDDIALILQESLRSELGISPREYPTYSAVLLVPDHGDRMYVEAMTSLLFGEMGFKELAIHQESHTAIFAAGMSTACIVDIGATQTSVTCIDEGMLTAESRIVLDYGGDDVTTAMIALLERANFPYRNLNLRKPLEFEMMDNLKVKICTLEEHLVASTPWDFYVLKEQGLTDKYTFRTYDENILAPLCFFDTRMIDFEEKKGSGHSLFWGQDEDIDDELTTTYDEPTGAMRSCITHLLPPPPVVTTVTEATPAPGDDHQPNGANNNDDAKSATPSQSAAPAANGTPADTPQSGSPAPKEESHASGSANATPVPTNPNGDDGSVVIEVKQDTSASAFEGIDVVDEASRAPLDAAIAGSISMNGTENKIKAAAANIMLIGGGSALKGLYPFVAERLPPLLRQKGLPIPEVSIVPPPRNLNPRFVCWKGASVMCNLESLSDMWIRRDEWEALGAKCLKERLLFL